MDLPDSKSVDWNLPLAIQLIENIVRRRSIDTVSLLLISYTPSSCNSRGNPGDLLSVGQPKKFSTSERGDKQ